MIESSCFPSTPYRQVDDECIYASYGTALYPFIQIPEAEYFQTMLRHLGDVPEPNRSGYDKLAWLHDNCIERPFPDARAHVFMERRSSTRGLDAVLKNEPCTAIVALSFPRGSRRPHSVCIAYDGQMFILRDSSADGPLGPRNADEAKDSVHELLMTIPTDPEIGEAIVFRALSADQVNLS